MTNSSVPHKFCSRKEQCVHPEGPYLPETPEYFAPAKAYKNGLRSACRACILDRRRLVNGWKKPRKVMPKARDGFKYCPRCEQEYLATLEFFYPDAQFKSGLSSACKTCSAKYAREWEARNKQYVLDEKREWRNRNPDKVKKHKADSQKRHPESQSRRNKRYAQSHAEKIRAKTLSRIALKKSAPGTFTTEDIETHYETQNGLCAYCGIRLFDDYHIDHVIPLTKGGSNWPDNLLLSCVTCNISKSNRLLEEWRQRRGW